MILNTIRLLKEEIFKKFFKEFLLLIALIIFEGIILSTSVLSIIPIADFLIDPELKQPSQITGYIINLLKEFNINVNLLTFLIIFIATNFLRSFFGIYISFTILKIKYNIVKSLTLELIEDIFNARWNFFNNLGAGKLLNTLKTELVRVGDAAGYFGNLVATFFQLCVYAIIPLYLNYKLTLLVFLLIVIICLPLLFLNKLSNRYGKLNTSTSNKLTSTMNETLQAAKMILFSGNNKFPVIKNKESLVNHIDVTIKFQILSQILGHLFKPLAIIAVIIAISVNSKNLSNLPEYAAIFWSFYATLPLITKMLQSFLSLNNYSPSYDQLILLRKKAIDNKESSGVKIFKNLKKQIELENICFEYGKNNILKNCSVKIQKNSVTLISGKSGNGKSTLVDVLTGLQKPSSGKIYYDNINLNEFNIQDLRKKISIVNQDPFLFYDTIRDNIVWAGEKINDEEVYNALKLANAYDFVDKLPQKIYTIVGERGTELSGGERQRIVLARALIRKPSILVLDEATNSLDEHSENMIKNTLKQISAYTTIIVIAHMSKLKEISDKAYELKDNKLFEHEQ